MTDLTYSKSATEETLELDPEETVNLLNFSVVLLGHAINKIAYDRRLMVVAALSDVKHAKRQLTGSTEVINKEKEQLFGDAFQKQLKIVTKAQEYAEKLLGKSTTSTKKRMWPSGNRTPFSSSSSGNNYHPRSSGGAARYRGGLFCGHNKRGKGFCQTSLRNQNPLQLQHVHPNFRDLFPGKPELNLQKAGKLSYFLKNWKVLTSDPNILAIVKGWKLPVKGKPRQVREPKQIHMSKVEQEAVDREVEAMLQKGTIEEVQPILGQFLSTMFVRPKKEKNEFRQIISLKHLNKHMPYIHFKMKGLKNVIDLLNQEDYMMNNT